ncbi:MAG TPA: aminomethyl-transferring glycine dehydrogenase subunit GcvPB, partial [Steroidobacteraceae bacterium]|nr:aminomethyl-transferring glycine dehydrogenase subunit GcvPB [Steroidobacteraceae bacterium]
MSEKLIFEHSTPGRSATAQYPEAETETAIPKALRRRTPAVLPEVSELQAVRHYTRLSQLNFSIDTHFYPLGSCTMKYNPRACNQYAMLPEFLGRHPLAPESTGQGVMQCLWELQEMLKVVTGMRGVSLTPMAGAQGEFAGVAMIRAYHRARGDETRREIIVPDAAHGTNPATATMCGCTVHEIPSLPNGDIDLDALRAAVGAQTAGIMLTNPSTLGVFERRIREVADVVHKAGGLLYYDGANLNAILGKVRPGDMGFDVIHMNLHKTFSTPHGGGGPGAGPVGVSERLAPFLPTPMPLLVAGDPDEVRRNAWAGRATPGARFALEEADARPTSIGKVRAFTGNFGMFVRAYTYIRSNGDAGLRTISEDAVLAANYLRVRLHDVYDLPYDRLSKHEVVFSGRRQ